MHRFLSFAIVAVMLRAQGTTSQCRESPQSLKDETSCLLNCDPARCPEFLIHHLGDLNVLTQGSGSRMRMQFQLLQRQNATAADVSECSYQIPCSDDLENLTQCVTKVEEQYMHVYQQRCESEEVCNGMTRYGTLLSRHQADNGAGGFASEVQIELLTCVVILTTLSNN